VKKLLFLSGKHVLLWEAQPELGAVPLIVIKRNTFLSNLRYTADSVYQKGTGKLLVFFTLLSL
jgi:hypothetical protein